MPTPTHAEERRALAKWIGSGPRVFGELRLSASGTGYRIEGPRCGGNPYEAPREPEAFRQFIRFDDDGGYRPLSGARTMRGDWFTDGLTPDELLERLNLAYPLGWRHRCRFEAGVLDVDDPAIVLGRQTGQYRTAGQQSPDAIRACMHSVCTGCVRVPCWHPGNHAVPKDGIPCPSPCAVFIGALCAPDPG